MSLQLEGCDEETRLVDLLVDGITHPDARGRVELPLEGYGYRWLRVVPPGEHAAGLRRSGRPRLAVVVEHDPVPRLGVVAGLGGLERLAGLLEARRCGATPPSPRAAPTSR